MQELSHASRLTKALNLSYATLAEFVGVSRQMVKNMGSGQRSWSIETKTKLLEFARERVQLLNRHIKNLENELKLTK